jgi:hypothetical protein
MVLRNGTSVIDQARVLLAAARAEAGELDAERQALIADREREIAEVRERFGERLRALDERRKLAGRLEYALDPNASRGGPKRKRTPKPGTDERKPRAWTPAQDKLDGIIRAIAAGEANTVTSIAEVLDVSHTTVKYGLDAMRETGLIRLAGQNDNSAALWALTREGVARADELNGVGAV